VPALPGVLVEVPPLPPKKRILAVDDDATALGALRQILLQKGYDVTTASSGEEALPRLESSEFDLFILDVAMPGMSGFDLCRRIRALPATKDVPVIFLTAKGLLMDMAEGEDAGSDLYLIKPVLAAKLLSMVGLFLTTDGALARRRGPEPTP
jgi:DNA-binding response OmpR family regulator